MTTLRALLWRPTPLRLAAPPRPRAPSRRRAARAVVSFLAVAFTLHVGFGLLLDYGPPRLRDPEYGKRYSRAKDRTAEHPGRPLVLCVGSSRTAMGVRPGVLADAPGGPLLVNFALAGSGPVMELMFVRRALADGLRPAAVVLEYWPAFLREDGGYREEVRINVDRLRPVDRQLVREYFADPPATEAKMRQLRVAPWYSHRMALGNQFWPSWLPAHRRSDALFDAIDPWGWLPGREGAKLTPENYKQGIAAAAGYYAPLFAKYEVSPDADRALRQTINECRAAGVPVALLYLPESTAFRGFVPPAAVKLADEHLAKIRAELNVPLIDSRGWVGDDQLPDGFHLTQEGAAAFTRRLAPAVAATFPGLAGEGR